LKDLARKGPSLLLLDNTNKAGENYRGRGEKADAVDVLYEVRDITGWTPESSEDWWLSLPEAGDHAWQARASRRRGQTRLRLAFIPSKFRLGIEPQPFAIELDLSGPHYTLADITDRLTDAAAEAARLRRDALQQQFEQASNALVAELKKFPDDGPMLKRAAEDFLMTQGLSKRIARNLIEQAYLGIKWTLRPIPGRKGHPIGVYRIGGGYGGRNNQGMHTLPYSQGEGVPDFGHPHKDALAEMPPSENGVNTPSSDAPISATSWLSGWPKSSPIPPSNGADFRDVLLFRPPHVPQQEGAPAMEWEEF
jgi:hypothetical protein